MSKKITIVTLTLLPLIILYIAFPFLPSEVPMHYDLFGNVTRYGLKNELYLVPSMISLVGFSFSISIIRNKNETKEKDFESFAMILCMFLMNVYLSILIYKIYVYDFNINMSVVVLIIITVLLSTLLIKTIKNH